ncbi:hypothetical protein VPH35_110338 [Triticum aestivum]
MYARNSLWMLGQTKKRKRTDMPLRVPCNEHGSALYAVALVTKAQLVHREGTRLKRKRENRNARSAGWEVVGRTPTAILRLWYMLPSKQLMILLSISDKSMQARKHVK